LLETFPEKKSYVKFKDSPSSGSQGVPCSESTNTQKLKLYKQKVDKSQDCMLKYNKHTYMLYRVVKSRRMRWAGHVARMGEERGLHRVLVGKPEGKRPLGRPRRRWEDNIKMDLQEVGGGRGDWMEVA
jgi:hypothetical protein